MSTSVKWLFRGMHLSALMALLGLLTAPTLAWVGLAGFVVFAVAASGLAALELVQSARGKRPPATKERLRGADGPAEPG